MSAGATTTTGAPRGSGRLRFLDRYAGIPLLWLGGAVRRRRRKPPAPRSIGIVKAYAIGDTVMLSAIVADLRRAYPQARLVFFAGRDNVGAARLIEGLDEVVAFDISHPWTAVRELRRRRLDVVLDFGAWPRIEAAVTALAGAGYTVGFRTAGQHRHFCFDAAVEHSAELHELENYRGLLRALGVEPRAVPSIPFASGGAELPEGPYVALHLWPGGYQSWIKEWPMERWTALVRELAARSFTIVLTGGPADEQRTQAFAEACGSDGHEAINTAGRLGLAEVVSLLGSSACVVSVNTGIMHLAAAAGAPTVGLNGPTSGRRWGPLGDRSVGLDSEYEGCGYLNLGSEYAGRRTDCMEGISVERVLAAVHSLTAAAA